jgi:nitrogen fixation protein FixH
MSGYEASDHAPGRPLTGWRTLGIAVACFGVVFAVNGYMAYSAISTFTGETEPSPYEHGLAYEKDIEAAKAQAALGWSVSGHVARDDAGAAAIEIHMQDSAGTPVRGLSVTARLESPENVKFDTSAPLSETAPGVYEGHATAQPGQWDFLIEASQGGARVFKSENRIALR